MPIYDPYSRRIARQTSVQPDVYIYNSIPQELRTQIAYILQDGFGSDERYEHKKYFEGRYVSEPGSPKSAYQRINDILCREYGQRTLMGKPNDREADLIAFLMQAADYRLVLDVVELSMRYMIEMHSNTTYIKWAEPKLKVAEAIDELNGRFRLHNLGYRFESGSIIRIDSEIVHAEVVKPTLALLSEKWLAGANEEFLDAHASYRHGKTKECLVNCGKAFESTMKAICVKRNWTFDKNGTVKFLIGVCVANGLLPVSSTNFLNALTTMLESGTPTLRNKLGGHGQGEKPVEVPNYIASYMLHMTATNIKMLVEAERSLAAPKG
jgi:hypothetical protein